MAYNPFDFFRRNQKLFFGMERRGNNGTTAFDFEFNQAPPNPAKPYIPVRTVGDVLFTFTVKNTSSEEPVTITSLEDDVYGPLAGDDDCKVGTVLEAGAKCSFAITRYHRSFPYQVFAGYYALLAMVMNVARTAVPEGSPLPLAPLPAQTPHACTS